METIVSIVTPSGLGGISVISLVGLKADEIIRKVFVPAASADQIVQKNHTLRLGHLRDTDGYIDEILLCRRDGRYEINIHGGPVVARRALETLAEAGAAVTSSETTIFNPSHPIWNNPAIGSEMLEAIPQTRSPAAISMISHQWSEGLSGLARNMLEICQRGHIVIREPLQDAARRLDLMKLLMRGPEIVIAGKPNVGKSSLVNELTGGDRCIVTDIAGTTRDWIREFALIGDIGVWITDTAGLWDPEGHIDIEAVRRASEKIEEADLVVLLNSTDSKGEIEDRLPPREYLTVASKTDKGMPDGNYDLAISVSKKTGLQELRDAILERLGLTNLDLNTAAAFTARQSQLLHQCGEEFNNPQRAEQILSELLEGQQSHK